MNLDKKYNLLHGGDYNVEQWIDRPDILKEDIRLMKLARVNVVTLGVFSWASLEPEEGVYNFFWLDDIIDSMYKNEISVILSTPSAGKPPWMIKKYPNIMRTGENRIQLLFGDRENQCNSNIVYREKVKAIDEMLGERYAKHPAIIMWHISNEMYGTCHCENCQQNFRIWLRNKYENIDNLNKQYWSTFWSHKYNDWSEIESPAPHGERAIHGLTLDYKRFYSDLSIDFLKMEIDAVKKYNTNIPITTNMFHLDCGINYRKLSEILDVISWDSYPRWHGGKDRSSEWSEAVKAQFNFDLARTLKDKPFFLMESTPSTANGFEVCKLKRPKMHMLSSMQAIASGSESVQYFQWRKSLGGYEKFHGAVVSHNGSENTRVFNDVCDVGEKLEELSYIKDTRVPSEVAIIFDWDNMSALMEQKNLKSKKKDFEDLVREHYEALIRNYVSVDVIDRDADFSKYKLIIAPVLYMFGADTDEKIKAYIASGGNFVLTYYSGIVNENDLVYEGWAPYSLNEVFGVKSEEIDSLCDDESNEIVYKEKAYKVVDYCDLIHGDEINVLATYKQDFYAGRYALTQKKHEKGTAYYIAFRSQIDFLYDFYTDLISDIKIKRIMDMDYVNDVLIKERCGNEYRYIFLMNFSVDERKLICDNTEYELKGYEFKVLKEKI